MGLTGIGNTGFISEIDVRIFLRDNDPDANLLIKDFEFSPEEIRTAQTLAVDLWNETPPQIAIFNVEDFPFRYHLILQTVANLLTMAGMRFRRNNMDLSITGGVANDQNKADPYDQAAERLSAKFHDWMIRKKAEINMNQAWGFI